MLVSHLKLSQQKDDTAEGGLKLFYCHKTLVVSTLAKQSEEALH